jgi:hypothetical protein
VFLVLVRDLGVSISVGDAGGVGFLTGELSVFLVWPGDGGGVFFVPEITFFLGCPSAAVALFNFALWRSLIKISVSLALASPFRERGIGLYIQ